MANKGFEKLEKTNRKMALRAVAAYRMMSRDAAELLACMPPSDLMAVYRSNTYGKMEKTATEDILLRLWQERWVTSDKGRWTYRLVLDIKTWYKRRHSTINFYLTQALTSHGCFASYLKKIGKNGSMLILWTPPRQCGTQTI